MPSCVRETSPASGERRQAPREAAAGYALTVGDRGRLVLPVEVRERLNIRTGDRLTLRLDPDGTIRLQTGAVFARSLVGAFTHLAPGRLLSDELIAERRREAAIEARETRECPARRRQKRK